MCILGEKVRNLQSTKDLTSKSVHTVAENITQHNYRLFIHIFTGANDTNWELKNHTVILKLVSVHFLKLAKQLQSSILFSRITLEFCRVAHNSSNEEILPYSIKKEIWWYEPQAQILSGLCFLMVTRASNLHKVQYHRIFSSSGELWGETQSRKAIFSFIVHVQKRQKLELFAAT